MLQPWLQTRMPSPSGTVEAPWGPCLTRRGRHLTSLALQVSGDYTIPAGAPLPRSAASLALPPAAVSTAAGNGARGAAAAVSTPVAAFDPASGRWRIQVPLAAAA